ncbi:carbohydrate-binding module family 1 protein [Rickenella mellea]|uniref:Carbohydrate-binding module family 1 protein n=1 Tax=Rickenella mellea TaxID=50990 RepID=A0A4Y7PYH0_9AGAM|nr:carbohydrate-binding module family 1 protein [Rickenella mellea]
MLAQISVFLTLLAGVSAQILAGPYAQCGGLTWTGPTECIPGWVCIIEGPYNSQCLPSATSTATTIQAAPTLLPGDFWVYATEAPNLHKYLQSALPGYPLNAVLGSYTTAAQIQLVNGQVVQQAGAGELLYLNVNLTGIASKATNLTTNLETFFALRPNPRGTFGLRNNRLTFTAEGIRRPNISEFLACGTGAVLNINFGGYKGPAGCTDVTLNSYNGATAVP